MSSTQDPSKEPFDIDETGDATALSATEDAKLLAGLSYISQIVLPAVLPVILLATQETKRSAYLRYHVVHNLAFTVLAILYYLIAALVYVVVTAAAPCLACFLWVLFLVPAGVLIYYGYMGFTGKCPEVPWLTQYLKQVGWV